MVETAGTTRVPPPGGAVVVPPPVVDAPLPFLGVKTGVGLVVANMIGAGVFLSAGYMAQEMGPYPLMGAWLFGAVLALCGARTYAAVAAEVAGSGGEYRYLSSLLHPVVGYVAGWGSLLLGFAAPVAVAAIAAGAFLNTLVAGPDPRITGTVLILALTTAHSLRLSWSRVTQNVLVAIKLALVIGFALLGLAGGARGLPSWQPPIQSTGFPWGAFLANQFWIAFAFSGWNAAVYASGEFRRPRRDVPRAMMIGGGFVAALYMLVNWVFVVNLTPDQAAAVFDHETTRITLGHLVTTQIVGPFGGKVMSGLAIVAFISAISAMTLVGPRVYAEMAKDGFLPRTLAGRRGHPPAGAVFLQGALAVALLWTHSVLQAMQSASAVLLVFSGLVAVALLRLRLADRGRTRRFDLVAAAIYVVTVCGILVQGFREAPHLLATVAVVVVVALGAYRITRGLRGRAAEDGGE